MKKQNNQNNEFSTQVTFAIMLGVVYWVGSFLNKQWFLNRLGLGDISDSYFFGFSLATFVTIILYKALFPNNDNDKESK